MSGEISTRVRYGKDKNGQRKGVLFTVRTGESIFYGVSRCGPRDVFDRAMGLDIARGRCTKAIEKPETQLSETESISSVNLRNGQNDYGQINTKDIVLLIKAFEGLFA